MARRRDIMRWGGALTAFLYLLGWMVGFAHNVTEQHVVCAEHGDLVHAGHGHGDDDHADHDHGAPVEIADAGDELPSVDYLPRHDDHEHCVIGPFLRNDDDVAVDNATLTLAMQTTVAFDEPRAFAESIRPPPVSILALAPKTSPPVHT